ncbi:MAG: HEAT repeat domain-containing protein [Chloroflexia bacterium]
MEDRKARRPEDREERARRPAPPLPGEEEIARRIVLLGRPEDPAHGRALDELVVFGRPAVPALIEALYSDNWVQAFRAGQALGLIGDRRAVKHLKRLLHHPNSNVRWGAAEALGRIRSRWARPALRRLLDDESRTSWGETVGEAAERAIASIDQTWVSRLVNAFGVLFYLALCVAVVYFAFRVVRQEFSHPPEPTAVPPPTVIVPTETPLPTPTLNGTAHVRQWPNGPLIGDLHEGDEILIYAGRLVEGEWWYLIRLTKVNHPATTSELLLEGRYGWVWSVPVAGVEAPSVLPTVAVIETQRALEATPTEIGNALELPTPTPSITATVTPVP